VGWPYTVTLRSFDSGTNNGFADFLGSALDGTNSGGGTNFRITFSVSPPPVAIGIPDFARGPANADALFLPSTIGNGGIFNLIYTNPSSLSTGTATITFSTKPATLQSNIQTALNNLPQIGTSNGVPNAVAVVINDVATGANIQITFQNALATATDQLLGTTTAGMSIALATINVANNVPGNGIPVALSNGLNVTSGTFTLQYNPVLLNVTGAVSKIAGVSFTVNTTINNATSATAVLSLSSPTSISATNTPITIGSLLATVPLSTTASYGASQLLHFSSEQLNGAAGPIPVTNQDAVEVAAYFGNVSGNGGPFSTKDVQGISNVAALIPSTAEQIIPGFNTFPNLDPVILGDVSLSNLGFVNATSAGTINQQLVSPKTTIPFAPAGLPVTPTGPDPTLSMPTTLVASQGGTVIVPVDIDTARPQGSTGMTDAILALSYDPKAFDVSSADVQLGSLPLGGSGWQLKTDVNAATGLIGVELCSNIPIQTTAGGSLITINMHVREGAPAGASGLTILPYVGSSNGVRVYETSVSDAQGLFTLHPAQTAFGIEPGAPGLVTIPANTMDDESSLQVVSADMKSPASTNTLDVQLPMSTASNTLSLSKVEQVLGNLEEVARVAHDSILTQPNAVLTTEGCEQAHFGIRDLALLQSQLASGQSAEWLPDDLMAQLSQAPRQDLVRAWVETEASMEDTNLAGLDAYFADESAAFKLR
jgi:hypothetical protein